MWVFVLVHCTVYSARPPSELSKLFLFWFKFQLLAHKFMICVVLCVSAKDLERGNSKTSQMGTLRLEMGLSD